VPKQDAVHRTYVQLRDLIVHGSMAPGSALIERRVAQVVGVSRTTVRNALQQLANEGLVVAGSIGDHYSRFFVGPLTIGEMRDWYFIYGALDGIAARGAARLPLARRRRLSERVRRLARAHLEAGTRDDPQYDRIQRLDAALHRSYVQAGGGPRVLQEHEALRPHVARYGVFYATALHKLPSEIFYEHCAIADAIEGGDPDRAERAAVTNWRNATDRFEAVMRNWGERGNWQVGREGGRNRSGPRRRNREQSGREP
jgi:DNA-binding GntR family transcriptional regulator